MSDIVNSFTSVWEDELGNVSSDNLRLNWQNNFDAFNEVINRNQEGMSGMKICCPSPTGSGKTQQIIHEAIDLYGSKVGTLIVVMRTADADIIASQIKTKTHDDYVAVFHRSEVSIKGVRISEEPTKDQCLIITHEMFRRRQDLTTNRGFIVIDEAIDVITHTQIHETDLRNMIALGERKSDKPSIDIDLRIMRTILDAFMEFKGYNMNFLGMRKGEVNDQHSLLKSETRMRGMIGLLSDKKLSPTGILMRSKNHKTDSLLRDKYLRIANDMTDYFRQFNFLTKAGDQATWHTARELIPNKSIIIMDATATVNYAYRLHEEYQPESLKVLEQVQCRDYSNVNLHTVRYRTGRYSLNERDVEPLIKDIMKNTSKEDEILIVSFSELEPKIMTYADSIEDRKIYVDHWGNLTGTNKYQNCNKIFIYGLNHKPDSIHRSIHALVKSPTKAWVEDNENKEEMRSLIRFDIVAETVQAINRIRCRRVTDNQGRCDAADVYLTVPSSQLDASLMIKAIEKEMPGISTKHLWSLYDPNDRELQRTSFAESFIMQLEVMLSDSAPEVKLSEVLEELDITNEQWRKHIKNKMIFKELLKASPFYPEMRQRVGSRGRVLKTKELVFVLGKN